MIRIFLSAAEASSDVHGAEVLAKLRELVGEEGVEVSGVGGPKLQAQGLKVLVDARELLSMGFFEVFSRLPKILSALRLLEAAAEKDRPQVAVVIDYPDFHFRLAKKLKRLGIPVVYFIPPKVWAWRKGRARTLKERFAKVLTIFPFETVFLRAAGVPVQYVGNPLLDELPLKLTRAEARERLGVAHDARVVALMPGSRPSELRHNLTAMLEATVRSAARLRSVGLLGAKESLHVLIPLPATADLEEHQSKVDAWVRGGGWHHEPIVRVRVSRSNSAICLKAADAGVIKSGTSTLEAALLDCPHLIIYRGWIVSWWIFKLIVRYRGPVGLSNLVHGWSPGSPYLVKELLGPHATVDAISEELFSLMSAPARAAQMREGFDRVRAELSVAEGHSPARAAAQAILEVARGSSSS